MKAAIVYNFYELAPFGLMPEAFIVGYDKKGELGYVKQRALETTVGGYDLEYNEAHQQLLKLIEDLQVELLEAKFNGKARRKKSLKVLWQDKLIKPTIAKYLNRKRVAFLELASEHQFPMAHGLERKAKATDFLLVFSDLNLQPNLFFHRFEREMKYRLSMRLGREKILIHEHQVYPLTSEPAWAIWDRQIIQIPHISGNMLKPFLRKPVVVIPESSIRTYFEKFVVKVASKVEIEARGFDVRRTRKLEKAVLKLTENFLDNKLGLHLTFNYRQTNFAWNDRQQEHTRLSFDEEEVIIRRTIRNQETEAKYIQSLLDLGLVNESGSIFQLNVEEPTGYRLLQWLIDHQQGLIDQGFYIEMPQLQQKPISLAPHQLSIYADLQNNDWFDVHGSVEVGAYSIPFVNLFPNIKSKDPFYPLEDGTYFVIPDEWMIRYADLAQRGQRKGKKAKFGKSLYPLLEELEEVKHNAPLLQVGDKEEMEYLPSPYLKATLRPYQLEGVKWLVRHYHNGLGACLADDMGLGKTLQTIATLLHAKENTPKIAPEQTEQQLGLFGNTLSEDAYSALKALIVLPASLVFNWSREIEKFSPHLMVLNYTGTKRKKHQKLLHTFDAILTTYQTALKDKEILKAIEFNYIILDESQHIKNKESKVFKAINEFQAANRISLSGTPIENSLSDLWAQMEFINPGHLGNFRFFKERFIVPIERQGDEEQKENLKKIIQPFLLRRTKEEVATDLPELTTNVLYTEMNTAQRKVYEKEKSAARNYLLENYAAKNGEYKLMVLKSLLKLRQLANHPKLVDESYQKESSKFEEVMDKLKMAHKSNHKVLVFSSFTKHLALFKDYFDKHKMAYSLLQGNNTQVQRAAAIQSFQEKEQVKTFLISLKAGGTGLNLTAADYVFILDPWWNPAAEQQAIARAHRIGQTKRVFATKFITKDTIEEKILRLQGQKAKLADDIINTNGLASYDRSDIEYLLT